MTSLLAMSTFVFVSTVCCYDVSDCMTFNDCIVMQHYPRNKKNESGVIHSSWAVTGSYGKSIIMIKKRPAFNSRVELNLIIKLVYCHYFLLYCEFESTDFV